MRKSILKLTLNEVEMLKGLLLSIGLSMGISLAAQEAQKIEIPVWGGDAPGSAAVKEIQGIGAEFISPKLTVFLPPEGKRSGAAVLIIPGGGYSGCAVGHEGFDIAKWMNERGIAGCVLQYRRPVFKNQRIYDDKAPSDDAFRSMRIIRSKAAEWGLKADKIGVMGFSAGGHLAATVGTHFDKGSPDAADELGKLSSRPDFMILIYPVIDMSDPAVMHGGSRNNLITSTPDPKLADYHSCQKNVTPETPPCFLLSTTDDGVKCENSILMYSALKAAKVPCELHIFEAGGHGYGMRPGKPVTKMWPALLELWLGTRGALAQQN